MKMWKMFMMVILVVAAISVSGCKPPLVEKFEEVKNNETAFEFNLKEIIRLN